MVMYYTGYCCHSKTVFYPYLGWDITHLQCGHVYKSFQII